MKPRVTLAVADDGRTPLVVPVAGNLVPDAYRAQAAACGVFETDDAVCDVWGGARRVLLVRVANDWLRAGARAVFHALREPCLAFDLRGVAAADGAAFIEGACLRAWHDDRWRMRDDEDAPRLDDLVVFGDGVGLGAAWARRAAAVEGARFARDLVTEPSNTLTPDGFVSRLSRLSEMGVELSVLRGPELAEAGLSGLLAVGGGSANPPALAVLRWPGLDAAAADRFRGQGNHVRYRRGLHKAGRSHVGNARGYGRGGGVRGGDAGAGAAG